MTYDLFLSSLHPEDCDEDRCGGQAIPSGLSCLIRIEYSTIWPRWQPPLAQRPGDLLPGYGRTGSFSMDGVVYDITEAKSAEQRMRELQAELLHATRLSTLGEMAGVLAHEINQPLSAAVNYLDGSTALIASGTNPGSSRLAMAGLRQGAQADGTCRRYRAAPDPVHPHGRRRAADRRRQHAGRRGGHAGASRSRPAGRARDLGARTGPAGRIGRQGPDPADCGQPDPQRAGSHGQRAQTRSFGRDHGA